MNLMEVVSGKKGENLCSATLQYLVNRSPVYRQATVDLLSSISPVGPITAANRFACTTELSTSEAGEERKTGRIDLVVETDDTVVGIEAKLWANFTESQPSKYISTLKSISDALNQLPIDQHFQDFVVILAPLARKEEIGPKIKHINGCRFLAWEDLLGELAKCDDVSPEDKFLFGQLSAYVKQRTSFAPDLRRILPHVGGQFELHGNKWQRSLRDRIFYLFNGSARRDSQYSGGKEYTGYSLAGDLGESWSLWFGFANREKYAKGQEIEGESVFLIEVGDELHRSLAAKLGSDIRHIGQAAWNLKRHAYLVVFGSDERWANPETWMAALRPFNDALEAQYSKKQTEAAGQPS